MTWHGYFAAEALTITTPQRVVLIDQLKQLGEENNSPQPSKRNNWRTSLDGSKVIFKALFNENILDINTWKTRLSILFNVDVGLITHNVSTPTFASRPTSVVTFSYLTVARFRVALFGGSGAEFLESAQEARAYLATNSIEWDSDV